MSSYTFLPWLRRGVIGLAKTAAEKERLSAPLRLHVIGEGEAPVPPITRNARLYGPGDVNGIDWRAIVRTVPRAGVLDFEANFLASIEFYEEDFPWRYTPALPDPATGALKPWIWLTVLEENEYRRTTSVKGQLPTIEVLPDALTNAFPDPDTTAAWAHVHLNFKPEGALLSDWLADVQKKLDENPNLGCSRLICPRRLKPQSRYRAFLLPAFEKGRLAGLGRPEADIDATPNTQIAWPKAASIGGNLAFPVYFEWEFSTASNGDFEDLASKLLPLSDDEMAALSEATQLLDVQNPGWGIKGVSGAIRMESALKLPGDLPPLPNEAADKTALRSEMAPLLNLSVEPLDSNTGKTEHPYFREEQNPNNPALLEDDPIVVPPLYGSFYRPGTAANPAPSQDWYQQLNLDPVYRIAAAQGTGVVQQNQETYMDRAWDQWSAYAEIQQMGKRWTFSEQLSQTQFTKRLAPMLQTGSGEEDKYRAVGFFSSMLSSVSFKGSGGKTTNAAAALQKGRWPSTNSGAFTKVTRSGGPLMRRLPQKNAGNSVLNPLTQTSGDTFVTPHKKAIDTVLAYLSKHSDLDGNLQSRGLGGLEPCKTALSAWQSYMPTASTADPKESNLSQVFNAIKENVRPDVTIQARFSAMVKNTYPSIDDPLTPPQEELIFPDPMYQELAARSSDFILPGLDRIPPNRVAIMEPNPAFIESYLTGLNHEMAREFLWREFPSPLNATCFRQFWDVRNASNPIPDILPLMDWGNTALGTHRPPPSQSNPLVVVIRGDLLRKYPNTEIFMAKAGWLDQAQGSHKLMFDPGNPDQWGDDLIRRPVFSAQIDPDYIFLGFTLSPSEASGDGNDPGWFFVLKERAGDVHFGLDIKTEIPGIDPSWDQLEEVAENQCVEVGSAKFEALPRTGNRADQLAGMLFQKPFMLFIHASKLLPVKTP